VSGYSTTVRATGDTVGNQGHVSVLRCFDGSTRLLMVEPHSPPAALWLTRSQATDLAIALLNAANGDRS
jgi:hypothetical protein